MRSIYIERDAIQRHEPAIVVEEDGVVVGYFTNVKILGPSEIRTHVAGQPRPTGQRGTRPKIWVETAAPIETR